MKAIALLDVDMNRTPLGTVSRLADELCGEPVLQRTVRRVQSVAQLSGIAVTCPTEQKEAVEKLLAGTSAKCIVRDSTPPAYRGLVKTARKWSLDAWRGGLGGSSGLDEYMDVRVLLNALDQFDADALAVLPPGSALIDPQFVGAMLKQAEANEDVVRLTFAQTPPGLAPVIMQRALCEQLASSNAPVGWAIAYKPDEPAIDLAFKPACYIASQPLRHAAGRLTADTLRSFRDMERIIQSGADSSADETARWLMENEQQRFIELPREVELELTIDSPIKSRLHPNADCLRPLEPIDPKLTAKLASELAEFDDSLVALGGHGDPVLHPDFCEIVGALRQANVYGISVRTTGQSLTDEHIAALIKHRVDVVEFALDAWTPKCYSSLTGGGDLAQATDAIERLIHARREAQQAEPIIVPSMTKSHPNLHELDAFFDGWIRKVGCAVIDGFSDYGGRLEDLSVTDMRPPNRVPCRRLTNRCFVAADGSVFPCDQDLGATMPLGHLGKQTLREIWKGKRLSQMRSCHDAGKLEELAMCARCVQWHRP